MADSWEKGRLQGWPRRNANADECVNGHAFDEANTRVRVRNGRLTRECRACHREAAYAYRDRNREKYRDYDARRRERISRR